MGRVSNGNQKGLTADVIACNLSDSGLVAVGGERAISDLKKCYSFVIRFQDTFHLN